MNDSPQASAVPVVPLSVNGLPVSEIRAELDSILKSRAFIHSHRIRRFLQFVVEECLTGRQHRLKEYLIGLEVFNRQEQFDPRVDSIVRVEARRLRMKIDEYYDNEGLHDDIRIELRKGSYVPLFSHRDSGARDGYTVPLVRRHSISIGRLAAFDGDISLVPDIRRRLAHEVIKGGQFRVLAGADASVENELDAHDAGPDSSKPDFILDGRLESNRDGVQLFLQLKHARENAYVWSDSGTPDRIQDLAGSLNREMVASFGHPENGRTGQHSRHRECFDYYLEGRYRWKQGSPESIRSSAALFEQALAVDPGYAAAWASLAEACMVNALFGTVDSSECAAKMKTAARHAIHLAPALPEAHVAQALVECTLEGNWEAGERSFQRAIQLDPRDPTVHLAYGIQLAARGILRPALFETQTALELDPASLGTHFVLGWLFGIAGRHEEAIAQHTVVTRLAPDFALAYMGLGWTCLRQGLIADALAHFTNAGNLFKSKSLLGGCVGHCHGRMHQRDAALRQLAQSSSPIGVAAIYCGLGDADRAFSALEQAAESRDCSLPVLLLNPEFDALRGDPRFPRLQEKLGLRTAALHPPPNAALNHARAF